MGYSILFVCLGNICRSPMAEAVMRNLLKRDSLTHAVTVDSAGTGDWHVGSPPHEGTRRILDRQGITYDGMQARKLLEADGERYDLIVAMDRSNERDIRVILGAGSRAKVVKMMSFLPRQDREDVPDPYYTGNFEEVYEIVRQGCEHLLSYVQDHLDLTQDHPN